jgi:hypothetical protein
MNPLASGAAWLATALSFVDHQGRRIVDALRGMGLLD